MKFFWGWVNQGRCGSVAPGNHLPTKRNLRIKTRCRGGWDSGERGWILGTLFEPLDKPLLAYSFASVSRFLFVVDV